MTLDEATDITFEPVRNIFKKAIDSLETEECASYLQYLESLGDIDEKINAKIAMCAFEYAPHHEMYENALKNIKKTHKGNINELMSYRKNVPDIIHYVGELRLQVYGWKYILEMFLNSLDNNHTRWTNEEDEELIEMASNETPEVFMAARLRRSPSSIKTRISQLVGVKRLSQQVAGKFIGEINGEQTEADLIGVVYKK